MSSPDNPYQAPQSEEHQAVTLGDDSEFLISRGEILCREEVELPRVCIASGTTEDLVRRHRTFHIPRPRFIVPLIVGVVALLMLSGGRFGMELLVAMPVGFLLLYPVMRKLGMPGFDHVSVTWYVADSYLRRCAVQQWIIRGVIVLLTAALGISLALTTAPPGTNAGPVRILAGLMFAVVCGVLSLFLSVERRLRCSGRRLRGVHKGLISLTGHSGRFTETVERIIHGGF